MSGLVPQGLQPIPSDLPQPSRVEIHRIDPNGLQAVWRFDNGRGLSVIQTVHSYGVEAALLRLTEDGEELDGDIDNPIVGTFMTMPEFVELLRRVRDMDPPSPRALPA